MVPPYVSRVLYSYAYVGPFSSWPSREANEFTSAFQLFDVRLAPVVKHDNIQNVRVSIQYLESLYGRDCQQPYLY